MATPTIGELETQLVNIIDIAEEIRKFGESNSPNFVGIQDTLTQSLETDHGDVIEAAIKASRNGLNTALASVGAALDAHLLDWARFLNLETEDPREILSEIYIYYIDNSRSVQTRGFTFGAASAAGGNVGTGNIYRVTKDAQNLDLEACTPEQKTIECIRDQNSGTDKNEEVFLLKGDRAGDLIELTGSGDRLEVPTTTSLNKNILQNPSFESVDLSGGTIDGWTSDITVDGTNYSTLQTTTTDYTNAALPPKDDRTSSVRQCLVINTDAVLSQQINRRRVALPQTPLFFRLWYNLDLDPTAAGTLRIDVGAISRTITVSGAGWQEALVPIAASLGQSNWFQAMNEDDLDVIITWTPDSGSGGIAIDDIEFVPMVEADGSFWAIAPGRTPFQARTGTRTRGDNWTVTDTATEAVVNRHLKRFLGGYLPHAASPTLSDP